MLQDEYYIIDSENNDNHPLFSWDQRSSLFVNNVAPVVIEEPIKLRLSAPIPTNIEWVDYHSCPESVVSSVIADVLRPLNIFGIQLVPAKVRHPNDPFCGIKVYWFIHVWNRIACLDKDKSEVITNKKGTRVFSIERFVLNETELEKVELKHRLVFELAEHSTVLLVHQSVKDVIESVNPKGCRFFKATEWNSDIVFD
jgi:hypothetical protein